MTTTERAMYHVCLGSTRLCNYPLSFGFPQCGHESREDAQAAVDALLASGRTKARLVEGPCPDDPYSVALDAARAVIAKAKSAR